MSAENQDRVEALLNHLAAWAQEEVVAQKQLLAALDEQSQAVCERGPDRLDLATQGVDECLAQAGARATRRERILQQLGKLWGVAPGSLSLGSIVLRAGNNPPNLGELREELRSLATEVRRKGRLVQSVLRMHQRVTTEILDTVLGNERHDSLDRSGVLLDAEI